MFINLLITLGTAYALKGDSLVSITIVAVCMLIAAYSFKFYYPLVVESYSDPEPASKLYELIKEKHIHAFSQSYRSGAFYPTGLIILPWGLAYVSIGAPDRNKMFDYTITLYGSGKWFKSLAEDIFAIAPKTPREKPIPITPDTKHIKVRILAKNKSVFVGSWAMSTITYKLKFSYEEQQMKVVNLLADMYRSRIDEGVDDEPVLAVLLTGPPGVGKTSVAHILGYVLDAPVVTEYNPTKPGNMLFKVRDQYSGLMIIVHDEFDEMMTNAIKGIVTTMPTIDTEVTSKSTLHHYLDSISSKPNIIHIFITNKTIDEIDKSELGTYVRAGRMNVRINMSTEIARDINCKKTGMHFDYSF